MWTRYELGDANKGRGAVFARKRRPVTSRGFPLKLSNYCQRNNYVLCGRSGRFPDPPEHLGEDLPTVFGTQSNGLVSVIFRLENFRVIVALEPGNR